jgi:hypothetical protein
MLSRILSNLPRWIAPAVLAFGLAACGGGGGMSGTTGSTGGPSTGPTGCSASTCGNAVVTLTDAPGDFASYQVAVNSVQLTKADGTVVETLGSATNVDFTQLVDVTELVSTTAIPQGEYVAVTMTLDYKNAAINVYTDANDQNTAAVSVVNTQVVDNTKTPPVTNTVQLYPAQSGSPTTVQVAVQLDSAHHFFVTPGKLSRLALDFNLKDSNTVTQDATTQNWTVTVLPTLVASVAPSDTKSIRVRGTVASVDTTNLTYTVNVAPFDEDKDNGTQVVVNTTPATTFDVDGQTLNQSDGIKALTTGMMTVAFGTLSKTDHTFTAAQVLAGTSVQSAKLDRIQGVVTSRPACPSGVSSDVVCLVVHSGRLQNHMQPESAPTFCTKDVLVEIGASTMLSSAPGNATGALTTNSPTIGSKVTAFGTAGTTTDSSGHPIFDATAGQLRLEITSLWGTQVATDTTKGTVTINLQAIEGLPVSAFTFAGSTNPSQFVVATGALSLGGVGSSAALRFLGFMAPYGATTPPDFDAVTLVNFTDTAAFLDDDFGPAGSTTGLAATTSGLTLAKAALVTGEEHFILIGPQKIDLASLPGDLAVNPDPNASGPFVIRSTTSSGMMQPMDVWAPDSEQVYASFGDFSTALMSKLQQGAKTQRVRALGQFDSGTSTFTAGQIEVTLL